MSSVQAADEKEILERLLSSWKRAGKSGSLRRPGCSYEKLSESYNPSLNKTLRSLRDKGFVELREIPGFDGIEHIWLRTENADLAEQYLEERYGVISQEKKLQKLQAVYKAYSGSRTKGVQCALSAIEKSVKAENPMKDWNLQGDVLKALDFLENNKTPFYAYEFSKECFGNTKYFNRTRGLKSEVCRYLRAAYQRTELQQGEKSDDILADFLVISPGDHILLKGNAKIVSSFGEADGTAFSGSEEGMKTGDMQLFKAVSAKTAAEYVITVENKTSYFRLPYKEDILWVYLGGYCSKARAEFLKVLHRQNPGARFLHFGDIDPWGFEILDNLKKRTGIDIAPFRMGVKDLEAHNRHPVRMNGRDQKKAEELMQKNVFPEMMEYLLSSGEKMEQEEITLAVQEWTV